MRVRKGLILGVILLLGVDIVWVGSAGISRHLFHDEHYDKPLFWTYFKTTLFSIYLSAFLFWRPWQRMCCEGCEWRGGRRRLGRWVERKGGTVMKQTNNDQCVESSDGGLKVDTSCGIDETTGQCTLQQEEEEPQYCSVANITTHDDNEEIERRQEYEDGDITSVELRTSHNTDTHTTTHCSIEDQYKDIEPELHVHVCPRRRGDSNRHARVVDGRLLFKSSSINGDTCPVNPPLPTCSFLVGPPEFQQLNCAMSEEDRCETGPLSPCSNKCCKVRFNRTIEVRQAKCGSIDDTSEITRVPVALIPVWKVACLSLIFGIVWFFANYLYALALVSKSVALVNTLSSMSSVFVIILAALPILHREPGDRITLSRFLVTLLSVGGAVLVSISDSIESDDQFWSAGALLSLGSAFLYAVYLVLLKKLVRDPDSLELPMFFGFVGLFNTILLLPLVVIWHYTGLEKFEWPPSSDVWTLLLINGFIGTVISELLWLGGVFLTSPLVGTLSLALVTPLSITYSVFIRQNPFSVEFFIGALIVVVCFVIVTVLDHFGSWDPLWALIKKAVTATREYRVQRGYTLLSEDSKRLIEHEGDDSAVEHLSF